jgi:predicted nucleic acid-binding protein
VRPRVVCDASALVALLLDGGPDGEWVAGAVEGADLWAPALVRFETANVIRRHELAGVVGADVAAQAHADLVDLPIECWPYELLAERTWDLRANLSCYDAAHVALAERLQAPLITLDTWMAAAPGVRCVVATPDHDQR